MAKTRYSTEEAAREEYRRGMEHLDTLLDEPEDFGAASFVEESLVLKSGDGALWFVDWGTVIYSLEESGLREDAQLFETWLNQAGY